MARRRIVQTTDQKKKAWGKSHVSTVTRQGAGGQYTEYRMPYYVSVPIKVGEEVIGWEKKRRAAASSHSAEDAIAKAIRLEREGKEAEEAWGRVQRGEVVNTLVDVEEVEEEHQPVRMNVIDCANQMMAGRKRYFGKKVQGHRHSYKEKQQNYLNHLTASGLATKMMDRLTLAEVTTWFIGFMETHAETTSARFKSWLIQVGNWGVANDYWKKNNFALLPELVPTVSEDSKRIFTFDEIDRMWDACTTPQQRAMLVLLRVGLRQGEVLATHDNAVQGNHVAVEYTLGEHENVWGDLSARGNATKNVQFLGPPKTHGSAGKVYIPAEWMSLVETALKCALPCHIRAHDDQEGARPIMRKFVVSNRFGLCWEEGSASKAMRNLMERAGVEVGDNDSTFHAWRHTFCSDVIALGADDVTVAYLMRHRDPSFSKSVYAKAREHDLKTFRQYREHIDNTNDYITAIMRMDEDRRRAKRLAVLRVAA